MCDISELDLALRYQLLFARLTPPPHPAPTLAIPDLQLGELGQHGSLSGGKRDDWEVVGEEVVLRLCVVAPKSAP